ncbi:hypothetical protein [Frigoribacterium sp. RIT-PI-h]|uniref:hypothetical protein n=1 Tax=Frigoribacterium sp. RIT-PI-h TaxID=1690245 RepID=UPI000B1B8BE6|nr:hypothetical protein [Frigoribacterium sp. RIT-PI-h]
MQFVSDSRRATARLVAVVAAVLLALVASVLVAPGAQAMTDTGDGGVFVPTTGRILDTANNIGYNTPMTAGEWRTIKVAGLAGVPADGSAGAVSVIATVAEMPGQGQLTGRPNAQTPSTLMTIYAGGGLGNTSNSAILALNSDGTIQVQTETKARLILDVQGYYTSNKDGTTAGGLVTVPGARIADTRSGLGVAKAQLKSGDTTTVQVTGTAGVPKGASAVVVNLIAINTSTVNGFLTPYAAGTTRPKNSLNYGSGNVPTSITAQVPLSADGKMTVYNQSSTVDLVVDVQGYFTAAGNTGAMFTPGTGRLYDTRTGSNTIIGNGETRSIQAAGGHTPAAGSGITAVVITLTALHAANSSGGATVWAEGAARPGTTSINFTPNSIRSNTITVPVSASGKINLNNVGDPTHYVLDVQGWYADPLAPTISCPAYSRGSWSTSLPSQPASCTVSVKSGIGGAQLSVLVDGQEQNRISVGDNGAATLSATVPPQAGWHKITAYLLSADEAIWSTSAYEFGFFDRVPSALLSSIQMASPTSFSGLSQVLPSTTSSSAVVTAGSDSVSIPADSSGAVQLVTESGAEESIKKNVAVNLPFGSQAKAAIVEGPGVVSYPNGNGTSTVPIASADGSVQVLTVISSATAPHTFAYPVTLPENSSIALNESGGVSIILTDGTELSGFDAPWAIDAKGASVPTRFELSGTTLTQVVEPTSSTAYPVVADPRYTNTTYYWTRSQVEQMWKAMGQVDTFCKYFPLKYIPGLSCQVTDAMKNAITQAHYQGKRISAAFYNCGQNYCSYWRYYVIR